MIITYVNTLLNIIPTNNNNTFLLHVYSFCQLFVYKKLNGLRTFTTMKNVLDFYAVATIKISDIYLFYLVYLYDNNDNDRMKFQ